MLKHIVIGPMNNGRYFVAYLTPGCEVYTPVLDCPTREVALDEADARNSVQADRDAAISAVASPSIGAGTSQD